MKEEVIVECRRHWSSFIFPGLIAFCCLAGTFSGDAEMSERIAMAICGAAIIAIAFIRWKTDYLQMTTSRIVGKTGVIKTKKQVSPISKVQDIAIHKGLFGHILGYSKIIVTTAGVGSGIYKYKKMTNGDRLQEQFMEIVREKEDNLTNG